jgi:23S rRNA (uracil1939-C5)-methyltransferase
MEDLRFRISAKSFYQTNSYQAYELYKVVRDFAAFSGNEKVYDLYTGTGTIACFISRYVKEVTGIDYVEDAIRDAKQNAADNNILNAEFYSGDIKNILNDEFINKTGKPDVIITDPPRAGMHEDVVHAIIKASPEKIIYVSCNPSTQARDLQLMSSDYRIVKIQAVDMFPHTSHVENVALLVKKKTENEKDQSGNFNDSSIT